MWSAWRTARATMVSVGLQAAPLVNWLPSDTNRFLISWVWPNLLTTPSFAFALMRLVPIVGVGGRGVVVSRLALYTPPPAPACRFFLWFADPGGGGCFPAACPRRPATFRPC